MTFSLHLILYILREGKSNGLNMLKEKGMGKGTVKKENSGRERKRN